MKRLVILVAALSIFAIAFAQSSQNKLGSDIPGIDKVPQEQREMVELYIQIRAEEDSLSPNEWLTNKDKNALDVLSDMMSLPMDAKHAAELRHLIQNSDETQTSKRIRCNNSHKSRKRFRRNDTEMLYDAEGKQIPHEWVEELKEAGTVMFTYEEMMERRKQNYIDDAKAKQAVEPQD